MRVAVSTRKPSPDAPIEPHFGHAPWFMIYDTDRKAWDAIENDPGPPGAKGAGIRTAEHIRGAGVQAVISGRLGPHPLDKLRLAGIEVCQASGISAAAAVEKFQRGELPEFIASPEDRCPHDAPDVE